MGRSTVPSVDELKPNGNPLAFLPPDEDPTSPTSLPPADTTTEPTPYPSPSPEPAGWGSGGGESAGLGGADARSDVPTSSRGSSGSALGKRATQDAARKAVLMAGEGTHRLLARDEYDEAADVWRADEDDAKSIGDPAGSIVHRHGWLGDAGNPDVVDGINALIGLGTYLWKGFAKVRAARALRRLAVETAAAAERTPDEPDEPTYPAPAYPYTD